MNKSAPYDYSVSPNRKIAYNNYQFKTEYPKIVNQQPVQETYKKRQYYEAQKDQEFQSEVQRDLQKQNTTLYKTHADNEYQKHEDQVSQLVQTLQEQDRELAALRQMKEQYSMNQGIMQNQIYKMKDIEEQCFNLMDELNQKNNEVEHFKSKIFSQTSLLKEAMVRVKELEQMKLKVNEQDDQRELLERKEEAQSYQFKKVEEAFRQKQEKLEEENHYLKNMIHKEENQREQIIQNRDKDFQVKLVQMQAQITQSNDKGKQLQKQNDDLQKSLERSNQLVDQLEGCLKDLQKQYESNKQAVENLSRKNRQNESSFIKDNESLHQQVQGQQKDIMILQNENQQKEDYIKQISFDLNSKIQEAQEAFEALTQQNKGIQKSNDELKSNCMSYMAIIDDVKKMQGEQSQKDQEFQNKEIKEIANKYALKLEQVNQDNYQLRLMSHQCEEENENLRQSLKQVGMQAKQLQENQQVLEKEIYIGREKYKDMQQRLENELKIQEEKNLNEFQGIEGRAIQMSDKLARKIQGLQALVKDRNQEIEVLQSQKNELLLKLCEGDSTYNNNNNNVRGNRTQRQSDLDWR